MSVLTQEMSKLFLQSKNESDKYKVSKVQMYYEFAFSMIHTDTQPIASASSTDLHDCNVCLSLFF